MSSKEGQSHKKAFFSLAFTFYLSVFVSAFLLFQIQPMIGKYILPWFGGGSSVWTTTMLFFMVTLLFGYSYAYAMNKLPLRRQVIIHGTLLSLSSLLILFLFFFWSSPITPPISLRPDDSYHPIIQVITVLAISVGLPYFLLSTTSSLIQRWFSKTKFNLSPYPLYALSNAGSLLGLLAYPFVIEVALPLRLQGQVWAGTFLVFAVLLAFACRTTLKHAKKDESAAAKKTIAEEIRFERYKPFLWLFLPLVSSMILLSSTSQITQSVAPAPFLWILPLGLYLLSFILCFSSKSIYRRNFFIYLFIISASFAVYISLDLQTFLTNLSAYTVFIFASFMLLHGELYHSRPAPTHLNLFYMLEALGSALGGIFVGIIAPLIFTDFWEFYIATALCFVIAIIALFSYRKSLPYSLFAAFPALDMKKHAATFGAFVGVVVVVVGFGYVWSHMEPLIYQTRNFYGLVSVAEEYDSYGKFLKMYNGRINHGGQYASGDLRYKPITYFGDETGIAYAMKYHPKRQFGIPVKIGVTGLGVGTIAAFGKEKDSITFYEINPNAIAIAYDQFMYLDDAKAKIDVIPGDARISMQQQLASDQRPLYDIIVLDAFVDDAVPIHLITKEAFATYLQLLEKKEGILAVNISNRYLNLEPAMRKLAESYGLDAIVVHSDDGYNNINSASWVILTFNKQFSHHPDVLAVNDASGIDLSKTQLWTDDYSNLFQALYLD